MEIRVLGPVDVTDGESPIALGGRRQRSVLAGLVAHADASVSADRLELIVWGERPPPSARASLQTYVSRLRQLLGAERIETVADGYALRVGRDELDAHRFLDLLRHARELENTDPNGSWTALDGALSLWRGEPFADLDANGSVREFAERLREARLQALEARAAAGLVLGRHQELTTELQILVDRHPLREHLWANLMVALYRSGRQAEALDAYRRCRERLAEDLGIEPSPVLQDLEQRVLRQDPTLASPTDARPSVDVATPPGEAPSPGGAGSPPALRNPFKGLRAFTAEDAADFHGRERLIDDLVRRVSGGARRLAIVGPSGSGKSSLVLAGLVPALTGRDRQTIPVTTTPGTHPFVQLGAALGRAVGHEVHLLPDDDLGLLRTVLRLLPGPHHRVLLVVDQAEELLTAPLSPVVVDAYCRNLLEALEDPHGQLDLVMTMRADFLDAALRHAGLAELLDGAVVPVPAMTSVELQAAIRRPAEANGIGLDAALVAELVSEGVREPASLPLLQFVLTEMVDAGDDGRLDLADLEDRGGLHGALARRAEEVFADLSPAQQDVARRLFLRMVSLDDRDEPTRRRVEIAELEGIGGAEDRAAVIAAFVEGRLLVRDRAATSGATTLEVAHEAVLREWPRCAGWIDDATTSLRLALQLDRAASEWEAAGRAPDYLLTGSRLAAHESWVEGEHVTPSPAGRALVEASRAEAGEREAAQRDAARRSLRRLRAGVAVLVVFSLVAVSLGVVAAQRGREAAEGRRAALAAAGEILVRQLSAEATSRASSDPEAALLIGLYAADVAATQGVALPAEAQEAMLWSLQELRAPLPSDGQEVVLSGAGGVRGAWAVPLPQLLELAAQHSAEVRLTSQECEQLLGQPTCPSLRPVDELGGVSGVPLQTAGPEGAQGARVVVSGLHTGPGAAGLRAELEAFRERTGIDVTYVEDSDLITGLSLGTVQRSRDVALVPAPGFIPWLQTVTPLVPMDHIGRDRLVDDFGQHLISWATLGPDGEQPAGPDGSVMAFPVHGNVKSVIWYPPDAFAAAGYAVPATWSELAALTDRMRADGRTPWCFAEVDPLDPSYTGWPATDWVEDLVLRTAGPDVYDQWVAGDIGFRDPRIRQAFTLLGEGVFHRDGNVHGGTTGALATPFQLGIPSLLREPRDCWLYHQATFQATFAAIAGADAGSGRLATFPTPALDPEHAGTVLAGADYAVAFSDRPEVRRLLAHLASPEFGAALVEGDPSFLSFNRRFDPAAYPDAWRRDIAETIAAAVADDTLRFDAADLMPLPQSDAFRAAMRDFLAASRDVDDILADLDAAEGADEDDE